MTSYRICLIPGDGIGPEIIAEAVKVLDAVGGNEGIRFEYTEALLGGAAIDAVGDPLPQETLDIARGSDAVLLAAVGGPRWDTVDPARPRPEEGLLGIRKGLGLFCNLRPVRVYPMLAEASPVRRDLLDGVDLVIVRELTGGLYFGDRGREHGVAGAGPCGTEGMRAFDTMVYTEAEVERIARFAFDLAVKRRSRVVSVDKANVLASSRLWREVVHRVAREFPQVELEDMLVDNAAMQLVRDPGRFDVIVTENTFGDILSDEASMLSGSLGMLASGSFGESTPLFEPVHGSAPDIAGRGVANPLAQIASVEMMLRLALAEVDAADRVERAMAAVLDEGWRTADIAGPLTPADRIVGTVEMGDLVAGKIGPRLTTGKA